MLATGGIRKYSGQIGHASSAVNSCLQFRKRIRFGKMKLLSLGCAAALFAGIGSSFGQNDKPATTPSKPAPAASDPSLSSQKQKASYSIGINIGKSFKAQSLDIDADSLLKGVKDALDGKEGVLSEAERTEVLANLQKEVQSKMEEKVGQNKKEGDAFLAENKKKEGIVTLKSGLQYKVLKAGTGPKPKATDTVQTNYRGTLLNGTEFDSSYKTGKPVEFGVGDVIKGWTEALQLMPVGSKWQLYIPSDLAYGEQGTPGGPIPPNSTLVFDIELVSIK
jgi:FKBP-type peptidyl-prolyl cis-trans isomerase